MHTPHPVSRRSVVTGLAWSIPAITAAAVAPAFAASPEPSTACSSPPA